MKNLPRLCIFENSFIIIFHMNDNLDKYKFLNFKHFPLMHLKYSVIFTSNIATENWDVNMILVLLKL